MAVPSKKIFSVGLNGARYYTLSNGYPGATNATVYNGVSVGGPVALTLEMPDNEQVAHPGNNSIQQTDSLPPNAITSATMTISREDASTIAAFTGTKVQEVESSFNILPWNTSQQGLEPTVAIIAYDQAKDEAGNRVWRHHIFPRVIINPKAKGMARERGDLTYNITPQICTKLLTGIAFNATDNGCTTAQFYTVTASHRITIAAWVTTSTETEYVFDTDLPKYITGQPGIAVYKNGVLMTYGATADATHYVATTTKITFGAALTNGDVVTCMYELADTAVDIDT